jgi:hypothetical protein
MTMNANDAIEAAQQRRVGAYHPIQRELAQAFEGLGLGSRLQLRDPGIPVSTWSRKAALA